MKKIFSFLLSFLLLFSLILPTYASNGTENINTIDMSVSANVTIDTTPNVDGGVVTKNVVITKSVSSGTIPFNGFIKYTFPPPTDIVNEKRLFAEIVLDDNFTIISGHEYSLNFQWGYNISLPCYCTGILRFYSANGDILKEQELFISNGSKPYTLHDIDISFVPDTKDLTSGYRCEFVINILQNGYNSTNRSQSFFISPEISLTDKDDDSGWFQKILNKINDVWESIKAIPDKIGVKISELKESISVIITDLKDNLIEGIKSLFIPRDNYFNDKLTELKEFFEQKLGVLVLPVDLVIDVLKLYNNIGEGSGILHLNEFKIKDNVLFSARDINLKELISNFSQELYANSGVDLYDIYLAFVDVIILLAFVRLIKNKYDNMIGSRSVDIPNEINNERSSS